MSVTGLAPARLDFELPPELEAHDPPEARGLPRDGVRLLVSRSATGEISHHGFRDLPGLLLPGDLLVVNTSGTLPAQVRTGGRAVHFATPRPDGSWLVELRVLCGKSSLPNGPGPPGQVICLPGGAALTLLDRATARLWRARLSVAVLPYLLRYGVPIRYSYVQRDWPLPYYQTVFALTPGSAEMPSASRPFTGEVVSKLVARGVLIAPLTLHTGVSSLEDGEDPYPEPYDVPPTTARLVNQVRAAGGRVIAAGTTVVRALETAALAARPAGTDGAAQPAGAAGADSWAQPVRADETDGTAWLTGTDGAAGADGWAQTGSSPRTGDSSRTAGAGEVVVASAGWTSHVVTPESGVRAVDGLLTGLHEPRSSHLRMLAAFAGPELLGRCYQAAIESGYLWHEFGDVHLMLP
jgi:S-adenosylmethionine:tRNA ribosyltransferase-isomerase